MCSSGWGFCLYSNRLCLHFSMKTHFPIDFLFSCGMKATMELDVETQVGVT